VETQKVKFISNKAWMAKNNMSLSNPVPASKALPEWYIKADRYSKGIDGNYYEDPSKGKILTWKSCHAFFDSMISGYTINTPCDVEFYINRENIVSARIEDVKNKHFVEPRIPMNQFYQPDGYYLNHFAWFIDWGVELPPGYSALYLTPMNRFDLPFINTTGIIDNDKVNLSGSLPFFVREGFTGVLSKGTPFVQIFPFKRENWEHEIIIEDPRKVNEKNEQNAIKYRVPNGGVYKNEVWEKRTYR
jgi:hypothetical protein